MMYFEDLQLNVRQESTSTTLTKEQIIRFAKEYDPQPFHIDEEAAKDYPFGLIASGAHTYAISLKLWNTISSETVASVGGLGIDEMRLSYPVRPGDQLRVQTYNESKRESKSQPGYGILVSKVNVINQNDEIVLSYKTAALITKKSLA
ncbi:MAG: MaoC/PaaZ C-terminal domain-containing protein [Halioglobus sp.]|nr:MaoC/PaaZ C-terminal domain-containing protein [Halioglobus sp.]